MKKLVKTLRLPMYGCHVHFIVCEDVAEEARKIFNRYKRPFAEDNAYEGIVIPVGMVNYYIIIAYKYLSHNTIAHELFHVTCLITEDREIKEQESQAWLNGHLSAEVYKYLQLKKIELIHG